jgi:hypothetical protein
MCFLMSGICTSTYTEFNHQLNCYLKLSTGSTLMLVSKALYSPAKRSRFTVRIIRNPYIHCVGEMKCFVLTAGGACIQHCALTGHRLIQQQIHLRFQFCNFNLEISCGTRIRGRRRKRKGTLWICKEASVGAVKLAPTVRNFFYVPSRLYSG